MSAPRVTLADFAALQEQLLQLKNENYELRERDTRNRELWLELHPVPAQGKILQGIPLDEATRPPAVNAALYPTELNPFGGADLALPNSPATGSGGADAEQGATGEDAGFTCHTPGRTPSAAVHLVRREAARRAFALRRAATLRLAWHGWRSAHTTSRILRNMQAAVLAARTPSPARAGPSPADGARSLERSLGLGLGLYVCAGCLGAELRASEEQVHVQAVRHAQQCSGFWRRGAAWRHAMVRQRERAHVRLHFHAWHTAHMHARRMRTLAARLAWMIKEGEEDE